MSSSAAGVASSSLSPSAAASASQTSTPSSTHLAKLDGVLYHFYAKTSALIATARLTHFDGVARPELIPVGQETSRSGSSSDPSQEDKGEGSSTKGPTQSASKRSSKWFAVETFDNDIFRDELRLWRSISQLIPADALDADSNDLGSASSVPTLVLDVVLDVSELGDEHVLILNKVDDDRGPRGGLAASAGRSRRIEVSGKCVSDSQQQPREHRHVLLERWRLDFEPGRVIPLPELPAFYKRSVLHFRDVFKLLHGLPSQALYERYTAPTLSGRPSSRASTGQGQLKLGVRLGAGPVWEQEDPSLLSFAESLDPEEGSAEQDLAAHELQPIATGIGHLKASVQYRRHAEFSVDDAEALAGLQDLSMEEDYFRPTMAKHMAKAGSGVTGAVPISTNTALRSLLSATADRKPSPISASGTPPNLAGRSPAAGPQGMSPTQELLSRSPGPSPSVFSTSASGRPVAGLSSLRSGVPTTAVAGTSPVTTRTPLISTPVSGAQPAVTSPSHEGAAFVAPTRRPSISDRRVRDLSGTSLDRSSPPSPTKVAPPTQIAPQPSVSLRPTNQRTASVLTALRSGSYSPSSPSPLAQQLSAQGGASDTGGPSPSSSLRGLASASSLRGVFSSYSPAASQGSLMSLSRTPPRAYTGSPSTASLAGADVDPSASIPRSLPMSSASSSRRRLSSLSGEIGADELTPQEPASAGVPGQRGVPTVAPRPISRYPSTFSYRQARQQGSLDGSATAGSLDAGQAEDEFAMYSRSWQARIEQRRMYASGRSGPATLPSSPSLSQQQSLRAEVSPRIGFAPRSLGDGSRAGFPSSMRAGSQGSTNTREDLDDLVRMIDLRAGESIQGGLSSGRSMLGPRLEARVAAEARSQSSGSSATQAAPSEATGTTPPLRGQPLSRSQVDEMLSRMAMSVNQPSLGSSAGATGQADDGSASGSPSSVRGYPPQREGSYRRASRVSGGRTSNLEPIPAGSPIGGLGGLPFARRMAASSLGNNDSESPAMSSVGERSDRDGQSGSGGSVETSSAALHASRPESGEALGGEESAAMPSFMAGASSADSARAGATSGNASGGSPQLQRTLRRTSGSLEIFPHDDVTFDEAEDGAAGRMELLPADQGSRAQDAHIEGGLGALGVPRPLVGAPLMGAAAARHRQHRGLGGVMDDDALQRRGQPHHHEVDDAEEQLARFGADLANHASSRGRGSHSPWRTRNVAPSAGGGGGGGGGTGGGGGGAGGASSLPAPIPRSRLEYPDY